MCGASAKALSHAPHMVQIAASERSITYVTPLSSGPFPVPYPVFTEDGSDLEVKVNDVIVGNWTFSGMPEPGFYGSPGAWVSGSVTFSAKIVGNVEITSRQQPARVSQYAEGRGIPARDANHELNRLVTLAQEALRDIARVDARAIDASTAALLLEARDQAQEAVGRASDEALRAESARDIAQGFAQDIVSQGNVPIYATVAGMAALSVPAGIKVADIRGRDAADDGLGGKYVRVDSAPPVDSFVRFRSADRYTASGALDLANGGWWVWLRFAYEDVTPFQFGAKGDRTTDDGPAISRMFAFIRSLTQSANLEFNIPLTINLAGGLGYRIETSVNATNLTGWSLTFRNGFFIGACAGKPIINLNGSRGYAFDGTGFHGEKANPPAFAYQTARAVGRTNADNQAFNRVSTSGYFTTAAVLAYAHETALHTHCLYFNSHPGGRSIILQGYNIVDPAADYSTPLLGGYSFINNKFVNCLFGYLPLEENIASITAVTNEVQGKITCPGHQMQVGWPICFRNANGMATLRRKLGTIVAVNGDVITTDVDTTALGTYVSGGAVVRSQSLPSILICRAEQLNFDCCYSFSYGVPQVEFSYADASFPRFEQIDMDMLFEGSGNLSNIIFSAGSSGTVKTVQGFRVKTYNSNAIDAFFGHSGTDQVTLIGCDLSFVDPYNGTATAPKLCSNPAKFAFQGFEGIFTRLTDMEIPSLVGFNGEFTTLNDGRHHIYNTSTADTRDDVWTPVFSVTTGALGTVTVNDKAVRVKGDMCHWSLTFTLTNNGTGAGQIRVTPPISIASQWLGVGKNVSTGLALQVEANQAANRLILTTPANGYPGVTGNQILISGSHRITA